jgi:hypothetical protein
MKYLILQTMKHQMILLSIIPYKKNNKTSSISLYQ